MKKIFFAFAAILIFACNNQQKSTITVSNTLDFDRCEIVTAPKSAIKKLALKDDETFVIKADGKQVAYQILSSGEVIFEARVKASSSKEFTIEKGTPDAFETRAYCKVEPKRMNDFLWENDKVAYRAYQTELIAKDGPSNGFDYFAKTTDKMIIDEWMENYLLHKKSYHVNHGTGCDCYKVGRTLGCGALAPYIDEKIILGENYTTCEILENGPLRVSAKLIYNPLDVEGKNVVESRVITLDAGSQLSKVEVVFDGASAMDVAVGIALKNDKAGVCEVEEMNAEYQPVLENENGYIAYEEIGDRSKPEYDNGTIYTGVVFPTKLKDSKIQDRHVLAIVEMAEGKPVEYYQGGATSMRGMTKSAWVEYLDKFSMSIRNPLLVEEKIN